MSNLVWLDTILSIAYKATAIALNIVVLFVVNSENTKKFFRSMFGRLWPQKQQNKEG